VLDVGRYQGHYFLKLALLKLAALQHPVPRMQLFVPCLIAVHYRGLLHMVVGLLRNGGQCGADDSLALAYQPQAQGGSKYIVQQALHHAFAQTVGK